MAERQRSLFDNELSGRPESRGLILRSQPDRPLTKAQRAFNRLIAKVEELRARMDREIRRLDGALAYYGEHLHPRLQRQQALRKGFVRAVAPFLDAKSLKRKGERETLRMIIAEQINEIVREEGALTDGDLRALFEQVHGVDFGQVERKEMEEARSVMEEMLGEFGVKIDLSDLRPDTSDFAVSLKMRTRFSLFSGAPHRSVLSPGADDSRRRRPSPSRRCRAAPH